jgi:predicted Zn-dependent protease
LRVQVAEAAVKDYPREAIRLFAEQAERLIDGRSRGAYAEAEKHFRAALKKTPSSQTYAGLGIALWRQGRADEAIASLKAAIEADPKNTAAQQELAQVLASVGRAGEAPSAPPAN